MCNNTWVSLPQGSAAISNNAIGRITQIKSNQMYLFSPFNKQCHRHLHMGPQINTNNRPKPSRKTRNSCQRYNSWCVRLTNVTLVCDFMLGDVKADIQLLACYSLFKWAVKPPNRKWARILAKLWSKFALEIMKWCFHEKGLLFGRLNPVCRITCHGCWIAVVV